LKKSKEKIEVSEHVFSVFTHEKIKRNTCLYCKSMGLLVIVFTGKKKGTINPGDLF
jgi:hypothetical protein